MIDKEIAKAIADVNKKVTEMCQSIDNLYEKLYNENANNINANTSDITDTQMAIAENYELTDNNSNDITDIQMAIAELYELIGG